MIKKMSGRMKKQAVCLQMLIKTKNAKLRKAILEHADPELIRALCECASSSCSTGGGESGSSLRAILRRFGAGSG